MNRLELEREAERRRQAIGRSFEKEHSMDECVERLTTEIREPLIETTAGTWEIDDPVYEGQRGEVERVTRVKHDANGHLVVSETVEWVKRSW